MKKIIYLFALTLIGSFSYSQSQIPPFINYQFVLRDGNGQIVPANTSGTLRVNLYDDNLSPTPSYQEDHVINTGSIGVVSLKIGQGTPVGTNSFTGSVNWGGGNVHYEVIYDGNTVSGKQPFASVPYAISTRNSAALPPGQANQTLFWDATNNKWVASNNLSHNGTNVGVGISPSNYGSKLHVVSNNPSDSASVFGVKNNAKGMDAAVRAIVSANYNASTFNSDSTIYGVHSVAGNSGSAPAIGVSALAVSGGTAYGVTGVASTSNPNGFQIGVYGAATNTATPHNYGGYFDGKVYVGDSALYFSPGASPVGNVLTMVAPGKAAFRSPTTGSTIVNITGAGMTTVNPTVGNSFTVATAPPNFSSNNIGNINGSYPNYSLAIPNPILNYNPVTGVLGYTQTPFSTTLSVNPKLSLAGNVLTSGSETVSLAAFDIWTNNSGSVSLVVPANNVGIGTSNPVQKLDVQGYIREGVGSTFNDEGWLMATPSPGMSLLRAGGRATTEMRLEQPNNAPITFQVNGTERMRIEPNGNVGIGVVPATEKLEVSGNIKIPAANNYLYAGVQSRTISIPAAAFMPESGNNIVRRMIAGQLYAYPALGGTLVTGLATYFVAPINLPQSATVTGVYAYVVDNDATFNISLTQLWRATTTVGSSGSAFIMANTGGTSSGNPNIQLLQTNSVTSPIIDNNLNMYYLRFGGAYTGVGSEQNIKLARMVVTYNVNKTD